MSFGLSIRNASCEEFATVIDWATQEGWNPGVDDLAAFYAADPEGFLMGWIGNEPVSAVSVVRYGHDYGFLGFYLVHPNHRGTGVGLQTWNAGIAHLEGRSIGLDGVVEQQDNYRKSGFSYVGDNVRFTGIAKSVTDDEIIQSIRPIDMEDLQDIYKLDDRCFGKPREDFISNWCFNPEIKTRETLACYKDDRLVGFGTIRQCVDGYKIGPLFCVNTHMAQHLFSALAAQMPPNSKVSIDVPSSNSTAVKLAEDAGLLPSFETARMARGTAPNIDWSFVYGITSFELG